MRRTNVGGFIAALEVWIEPGVGGRWQAVFALT